MSESAVVFCHPIVCLSAVAMLFCLVAAVVSAAIGCLVFGSLRILLCRCTTPDQLGVVQRRLVLTSGLILVLVGLWCVSMAMTVQSSVVNLVRAVQGGPTDAPWPELMRMNVAPPLVMAWAVTIFAVSHTIVVTIYNLRKKNRVGEGVGHRIGKSVPDDRVS